MTTRLALLSVSDKRGVVELAQRLQGFSIQILSTGGTARLLQGHGIPCQQISQYTGLSEIMGGRIKTLHPKIFGGILALRDDPAHMAEATRLGIEMIDLVVVNLYPFEEKIKQPDAELKGVLQEIDIGGPSMIRAAAKNFLSVTVVVDPGDYPMLLEELDKNGGTTTLEFRRYLAAKAFRHVALYDSIISRYLRDEKFPETLVVGYRKVNQLRYGENPHQQGAYYTVAGLTSPYALLSGKQLSYTNILDLEAAWGVVSDFEGPTCAIIKHTNPCGAGSADSVTEAFLKAFDTDPLSAYGGVIGLNNPCDLETSQAIVQGGRFFELIVAPGYDPGVLDILRRPKWGKDLRIVSRSHAVSRPWYHLQSLRDGGLLVQEPDDTLQDKEWELVTVPPTESQRQDLAFAWRLVKHVKSNGIVLVQNRCMVGVGAGQTSRLDAVRIAISRARHKVKGAVMASDAFFPFKDAVEEAISAGISAIIQPGGSMRDPEVIAVARSAGIPMIFTRQRHFRH